MNKFEELRAKWKEQRELFMEWKRRLSSSAVKLKNKFSKYLGIEGKKWIDPVNGKENNYIYWTSLDVDDSSEISCNIDSYIGEHGILALKLIVTLDNTENTFPKHKYSLPIALKITKKEINYCFWNSADDCEESQAQWTPDVDAFMIEMLNRLELHFSFDPMEGIPEKPSIGFIPS